MSLFSYFIFIFIFRFFFTAHSVIYSPCFISKIFTSRLKLTVGGLFESGLLPKVGKKGYQQAHTLLHFGVCNWKHQLSPQRGYIYIIEDYSSVCLSRSELNNPATNRLPSRPPTQLRPPSSDLSHHILASVDPRTKKTPAVPNPVSNYYTKKKKLWAVVLTPSSHYICSPAVGKQTCYCMRLVDHISVFIGMIWEQSPWRLPSGITIFTWIRGRLSTFVHKHLSKAAPSPL